MRSEPRSVLVLGLGRSGLAAARLAVRDGATLRVSDLRLADALNEAVDLLPEGTPCFFGGHPEGSLDGVDTVIVSPGVPPTAPILESARRRGIEICAEVEFAWRHRPQAPLIAITGSNGKSTVTSLVAEILRAAGIAAVAGGNLGTAACDLVLAGGWQTWVLEVSSFQAEMFSAVRPRVAVFLNLSQDHLERHPTMESYKKAKQRLFDFQTEDDVAVLNLDDPSSAATATAARRLYFSLVDETDAWLDGDRIVLHGEPVLDVGRMALSGRHNVANAMAAMLAAHTAGVTREAMVGTLESFAGLAHRHSTVHDEQGVRWVDDSKATNVGATLAALTGYAEASVHLVLGGQGKGQDFSVLRDEVRRAVARVYLIGEDAHEIGEALAGAASLHHCGTLEGAVARARAAAQPGQCVVLAPACASFDQFRSYAERGERFAELARQGGGSCR